MHMAIANGEGVAVSGVDGGDGVPKIASPIFKQSFNLRTGQCLEKPEVTLTTYRVRVSGGQVEVEIPAAPAPGPDSAAG
jgi:nitrite reductase (NADH) small subunit